MKHYIKGIFRRSIFESEKGYIIGVMKVKETNDPEVEEFIDKTITFTGYFSDLKEEDTYLFHGELINHPKYGLQYQVTEFERLKPEDKDGIVAFLSSDLFPGIGEKQATAIVNVLGEKTLDKILEEPACLNLVPKLSQKKANLIVNTLTKYEASHTTIVYLTELGFSTKDALTIYNHYKDGTISMLECNPYQLVDDLEEINFLKVDRLKKVLAIDDADERRVKACIFYSCNQLVFQTGNTYFTLEEIETETASYLKKPIDLEKFQYFLDELRFENKLVFENGVYYLRELFDAETNIAQTIAYLVKKETTNIKKLDVWLEQLEQKNEMEYNDKQKEAIKAALENNVVIITGGPGTGKTTIIKAIVDLYQSLNHYTEEMLTEKLALLAPTGRASKRMSESTLFPASTIHRFLKWNKETNNFAVNEFEKSWKELIIVDEVSMIDTLLLDHLLKGLTPNIHLVLVGDDHQLPSVGAGQVLKDLIESQVVPTIQLDLLYRQSEDSYIVNLASEVKENCLSATYLTTTNDYTFLKCQRDSLAENLKRLCIQIVEKGYDYKRVQVMAPMYAGPTGIDHLNQELQEVFNPKTPNKNELLLGDVIFREQDKILQLVNMPEENVFNGDIGIITRIVKADISKTKKNEIYVDFDGITVKFLPKDFSKMKHGYIISIHKSQGSEFEMVVLPITMAYFRMLYRKLFYTAITRAKKKLILVGEPKALLYAVQNEYDIIRKTSLKEKLKELV